MTVPRLTVLPGPDLRHGILALLKGATEPHLTLVPDHEEHPHEGHRHNHEISGAACRCEDFAAVLRGMPCPKHQPDEYAIFTPRRGGAA